MARDLREQKFLGYIGHLVRIYGPRLEAAYKNYYKDPETFFRLVEQFLERHRSTERTYKEGR